MSADHVTGDAHDRHAARTEASTCAAPSCWSDGVRVRVGEREAVLCETHRRAFLGVSS